MVLTEYAPAAARSSRYYDGGGDDDTGAQDRKPLWEKLKENNDKKQADFEEKISLKNSAWPLDPILHVCCVKLPTH